MTELTDMLGQWFPGMRLVFLGMAVALIVKVLETFVERHWGLVFGIPLGTIRESYPGDLADPRAVDLEPHLHELATVRWLSRHRLVLQPIGGEVNIDADAGSTSSRTRSGWMCIGDVTVESTAGTTSFHGRVLLRFAPLVAAIAFVASMYVEHPWGLGWSMFDGRHSWLWRLLPLLGFGGFFAWTAVRARTGVITAYHSVTSAFLAAALAREESPR